MRTIKRSILLTAVLSGFFFQLGILLHISPNTMLFSQSAFLTYITTATSIIFGLVSVMHHTTRTYKWRDGLRYFALGWLIGFFLPGVLLLLYTYL